MHGVVFTWNPKIEKNEGNNKKKSEMIKVLNRKDMENIYIKSCQWGCGVNKKNKTRDKEVNKRKSRETKQGFKAKYLIPIQSEIGIWASFYLWWKRPVDAKTDKSCLPFI